MTIERNAVLDLIWRIHPKVFDWSGGRIGGSMRGMPILLLTTIGRKSGRPRTKALMYLPYDVDFVVIASSLGSKNHPASWLNLEANPDATIQIDSTHFAVRAREAEGEEREQLWGTMTDKMSEYDDYQAQTSRRIPVVVLERK